MAVEATILALLLQAIWVVDDDGGPRVDFTDIPPAIATAADGDILEVRPGTYSHFHLSKKGLRILGTDAASTVVARRLSDLYHTLISDVPAHTSVYLDRLRFLADSSMALKIEGSSTTATLADVVLVGNPTTTYWGTLLSTPLSIEDARVQVHRATLLGGNGIGWAGELGTPGCVISNAACVHIATSLLQGGDSTPRGILGGAGIVLTGLRPGPVPKAWIADSRLLGGSGGNGNAGLLSNFALCRLSGDASSLVRAGDPGCPDATASPGIASYFGGAPVVEVHSVPVEGSVSCSGVPTPPTVLPTVHLSAAPLPILRIAGELTLRGAATVSFTNGPARSPFLIAMAFAPGFASAGTLLHGEILIDPSRWYPLFGGTLSPTGDFTITLPLTGIAPSFAYTPVYLQGIALDPSGGFWRVSNATVATLRP